MPWVDQSLPPYSPPSPQPVKRSASAAPCHAADLEIHQGRRGAAAGNILRELIFVNRGTATCLLKGSPRLSAIQNGERTTVLARPHDDFFGQLDAADLKHGGFSLLRLHYTGGCANPNVDLTGVRVVLANGESIAVPDGSVKDVCAVLVSDFGLPRQTQRQVAKPGTPSALEATLDLPDSAQSGTTLAYTVTLTNPSAHTVTLRPCPGYTQGVFAQGYATSLSYRLNCGTVTTIAPNGKVTYDMKLDLPPTKEAVDAKLAWGLNMPVGPYAAGTLHVNAG